jgi:hypothetical protein
MALEYYPNVGETGGPVRPPNCAEHEGVSVATAQTSLST